MSVNNQLETLVGEPLQLCDYWRSSSSYRVRIALNLKQLEHQLIPVDLRAGDQHLDSFRELNPQQRVPMLIHGDTVVTQSLTIIDYLSSLAPQPELLPTNASEAAYVRALAELVACDMQPLNNLSVLQYLTRTLGLDEDQRQRWYQHWVARGFYAFESLLESGNQSGLCCFGDEPTLADICLIPQVYNAERYNCPMNQFPRIQKINAHCLSLAAFQQAQPEQQLD